MKSWTIRGTLHVFLAEDLPLFLHQGRKNKLRPCDTLEADDKILRERKLFFAEIILKEIEAGNASRDGLKKACAACGMTETEEEAVQEDLKILASGYPEVGTSWSRGTIKTASLLADCETEEEFAAVWLSAFALSLTRKGGEWDTTKRNAAIIEQEACSIVTKRHGYWHASSRDFFPVFYIPTNLFWESKDLSAATLVELAAINAALVMAHFIPVEYKVVR